MTHSPVTASDNKKLLRDECCDLYGEYCYPCNTSVSTSDTAQKDGRKKLNNRKQRSVK